MLLLVLSSIALFACCAWFLAKPFRELSHEQEILAQARQYGLARDRVLRQLEQLEAQADEGVLEPDVASDETLRLEAELASILNHLEKLETRFVPEALTQQGRLQWLLALAVFALVIPLMVIIFYTSWQADTLLKLVGVNSDKTPMVSQQAAAPAAFPPEVLAMVAQLEKRLVESPDNGEGWKRLGRAYMVMKRYSEAVSAYTSAAEILPNDQSIQVALQKLSQIAEKSGLHKGNSGIDEQGKAVHPPLPKGSLKNIIQLEKAIAKQPDNAAAWAKLGQAYIDINRQANAIRALRKAHELAEDDVMILSIYAETVFNQNPRDPNGEAFALYAKLNKLSPRHPDGLWFLGLAAYSEGNLSKTIDLWRQLLTVLPPDGEGYASVSQALAKVEILLNKDK